MGASLLTNQPSSIKKKFGWEIEYANQIRWISLFSSGLLEKTEKQVALFSALIILCIVAALIEI